MPGSPREAHHERQQLLERIQDGVVIIQRGRLVYANQVFADLVGDSTEALRGRDFLELVPAEDRREVGARYREWEQSEAGSGAIEFRLLSLLARNAGKVLTHRQLLRDVWGPGAVEHTHYLRVHMAALRRKIERDAARPHWLLTEPGVGYRLRDTPG